MFEASAVTLFTAIKAARITRAFIRLLKPLATDRFFVLDGLSRRARYGGLQVLCRVLQLRDIDNYKRASYLTNSITAFYAASFLYVL